MTDRILRMKDITERTGLCRATIYLYIQGGKFPRQVQLGARAVGWRESEVNDWIQSLKEVRS